MGFGGLKGFSRICAEVGVDPKFSEWMLGVRVGVSGSVILEFSEDDGVGDCGILNVILGV